MGYWKTINGKHIYIKSRGENKSSHSFDNYDLEREIRERNEDKRMKELKEQYKRPKEYKRIHRNKRGVTTIG